MKTISKLYVTIFIVSSLHSGSIQNPEQIRNRSIEAHPTENNKINIDGKLTEESWKNAPKEGGFTQRSPEDGQQSSQDTNFSVLFDEENLYLGIWMLDTNPESIDAILTRRDGHSPSDWLYISLDSYNDNRTAFEFSLNAAGVKQDLRRFDDDNMDWDWDAVWEGEVDVNETGWTAEFQIPFRELRFNTGPDMEWGLQVYREYWTSLTLQDSERSHKLTLQRRIYDTEETQIPERV
ncbi:MAG: carbohydrate binding family 9 domain-containing protein [Candidatus Marinimicrobia bacterium]|nr:carbohydrate binding family 9 domain-containing protein [Candidatus Neomarinimicrobiota bacterium]MBT3683817.1 carbohydrate binding family 9 domain-containing protein [Candidatus Neomarinimicrobiota bacterium]MBT3760638.1 carbohydrate binding family 9 domain-containing protein [Candidatus Neomarinimicrobiota bacterium]MBT4173874.1 carbohydrate binding family 9 domain-containing protein [Candidatus Neomarinimicrobiota bacterium]MBT4852797.1 carbohydrate binding family 9 domain-containing prot